MILKPFFRTCWLALLALLVFTCDKVEQVDDPAGNAQVREGSLDECKIYLVGAVFDAKSREPLTNVEVNFNSSKVFTNGMGQYRLQLGVDGKGKPGKIMVAKNGFVFSTFEVDLKKLLGPKPCDNDVHEILVDFVLSPESQAITLTPEGGVFEFSEEVKLLQPNGQLTSTTVNYTLEVPAGAVASATSAQLTLIHPEHLLGNRPAEVPLRSFDLKPANLNLLKPLTIRTTIAYPMAPAHTAAAYQYGEPANNWTPSVRKTTFSAANQTVSFEINKAGKYLLTNSNEKLSVKQDKLSGNPWDIAYQEIFTNCNCGAMLVLDEELSWPIDFKLVDGSAEIVRMLNLPISLIKKDPQDTGFWSKVKKCEVSTVTAYKLRRSVIVTINGLPHNVEANYVLRIQEKFTKCPVESSCHQGCP